MACQLRYRGQPVDSQLLNLRYFWKFDAHTEVEIDCDIRADN